MRSEVHKMPLCQKRISDNGKVLLLENVTPSRPDKVPGQWHPHDIIGNGLDGGDGILLADLARVKSVVQVSGSGKSKRLLLSDYIGVKQLAMSKVRLRCILSRWVWVIMGQ